MNKLKEWIASRLGAGEAPAQREETRHLAVAALLVEVLRADYETAPAERAQVVQSLRGLLGLDAASCSGLLAEAEREVDGAHDLHQFTSELNRALSPEEKLALVEQLWRVAQSDAIVHKYEEHLIRRVADLLHVPHREFIAAKLRVSPG